MEAHPYQAPQSSLLSNDVYCRYCAAQIARYDRNCSSCKADQNLNAKSKIVAGFLALFLGSFGVHRFYLGQWWGIVYMLFYWTGIPFIAGVIEGIVFFSTSNSSWNAKYGNAKYRSTALMVIGMIFLVFFIGIMASISIPAYQKYKERAAQRAEQVEQQR